MASQEPLVARYNLIPLLTWCHRNIRNLIWKVMRFATLRYCSRFEMFHFHFTWIYCCCIFFNSAQYTCTTTRTRLPVIFLLFLALVKLAPASPFYVEMDSPSQKVSCFIDVAKPCRSVKWDCNLTPNFSCNWSRDDICVTLSQKKSEPRAFATERWCCFYIQYVVWIWAAVFEMDLKVLTLEIALHVRHCCPLIGYVDQRSCLKV